MPKVSKRNSSQPAAGNPGGVKAPQAQPAPTPAAAPAAPAPAPAPNTQPSSQPSAGQPAAQPQPSAAPAAPQSGASYPYHDALAHFPRGAAATAAVAQNAAVDAEKTVKAILADEFQRTEDVKDVIGCGIPGEVTAMSAAAALVGDKIPGLEHVAMPAAPQGHLDVDPGLADMQGIIKRAHPTFADAVDEFAVEVQLNQINQGDI